MKKMPTEITFNSEYEITSRKGAILFAVKRVQETSIEILKLDLNSHSNNQSEVLTS